MTDKKPTTKRFTSPDGIVCDVTMRFVKTENGSYDYWIEVNGCQENKEFNIPNPKAYRKGKLEDIDSEIYRQTGRKVIPIYDDDN